MNALLNSDLPFWNAVVIISALGIAGWVVVSTVKLIVEARARHQQARLELERDHLRVVLSRLEEIQDRLGAAKHDDAVRS